MPSQLAHVFFAIDSIAHALPKDAVKTIMQHRGALGLGAQGPDIFLHNRRSKPSALRYGARLHRADYGSVLADAAVTAYRRGADPLGQTAAYLYGFATHATLDRFLHPYINYCSGWFDRDRPETATLRAMHAFLERLIDTALMRARHGTAPSATPLLEYLDLGAELPESIARALQRGLHAHIPGARTDPELALRVHNAYRDARGYYRWAHHDLTAARHAAARSHGSHEQRMRRLTILHPDAVPVGLDVLNLRRRRWRDPCPDGRTRNESVPQLYRRALDPAAAGVVALYRLLTTPHAAEVSPHRRVVLQSVGNSDLSDHYHRRLRCRKRFSRPLPLRRLLELLYTELSAEHPGL